MDTSLEQQGSRPHEHRSQDGAWQNQECANHCGKDAGVCLVFQSCQLIWRFTDAPCACIDLALCVWALPGQLFFSSTLCTAFFLPKGFFSSRFPPPPPQVWFRCCTLPPASILPFHVPPLLPETHGTVVVCIPQRRPGAGNSKTCVKFGGIITYTHSLNILFWCETEIRIFIYPFLKIQASVGLCTLVC